jgi:MYXO-CTERM domain-containing protein
MQKSSSARGSWVTSAALVGVSFLSSAALAQAPGTGVKPRGITLQVPLEHVRASGGVPTLVGRLQPSGFFAGPGQPPLPVFLNRSGGRYTPGRDDSRANTSIVPNGPSTVTGFGGSQAQWDQVVACVTAQFAPFNVQIVQTEPAGGEYVEAVIGGRPQQLGLPNGVGGVAPIDQFQCNIIPNAIVFAFSDVYANDPQDVCETAAQEIAHAISLDHELHCPDPMTYLSGCGNKSFRDVDAQCGEYQARACNCGRQRQNSVQVLIEKLGANNGTNPPPPPPNDPTPPTVSITSPADGATLPSDSVITVTADAQDNVAIAATELLWPYSNTTFACPTNVNGGSVTCTRSGNVSTWQLRVGQGDRRFSVRARDTAGNTVTTPERTIRLGMAGMPPPPSDTTPPTVAITSPANGASIPGSRTIQVVATAQDNLSLGAVELVWAYGGDTFPCPFSGQGVSCAQSGSTYTWSLNVGVGTRQFSVRATDGAGNVANTPDFTISLITEPTQPPPTPGPDTVAEDNDTAAEAFASRCGSAIDLVVASGDDDWFRYDAPVGTVVEISVGAAAGTAIGLELFAEDGTTRLANADDVLAAGGTLMATSVGAQVLARVRTSLMSAPYRLTAVCTAGNPPSPSPSPSPSDSPSPSPSPTVPGNPGVPAGNARSARQLAGGCGCGVAEGAAADASLVLVMLGLGLVLVRRRR